MTQHSSNAANPVCRPGTGVVSSRSGAKFAISTVISTGILGVVIPGVGGPLNGTKFTIQYTRQLSFSGVVGLLNGAKFTINGI